MRPGRRRRGRCGGRAPGRPRVGSGVESGGRTGRGAARPGAEGGQREGGQGEGGHRHARGIHRHGTRRMVRRGRPVARRGAPAGAAPPAKSFRRRAGRGSPVRSPATAPAGGRFAGVRAARCPTDFPGASGEPGPDRGRSPRVRLGGGPAGGTEPVAFRRSSRLGRRPRSRRPFPNEGRARRGPWSRRWESGRFGSADPRRSRRPTPPARPGRSGVPAVSPVGPSRSGSGGSRRRRVDGSRRRLRARSRGAGKQP